MRKNLTFFALLLGLVAAFASTAQARPANIHIKGTAPENYVNIRPAPSTAGTPVGRIPEGASPDYDCFTYGETVGGVPVWFHVSYGGAAGYYASFFDDSSYRSDTELTAKYGIPKCGAQVPPPLTPPPAATGGAVFYGGIAGGGYAGGQEFVSGPTIVTRSMSQWYTRCDPAKATTGFGDTVGGRQITTLAGFSLGRLGPIDYLAARPDKRTTINRVVMFDPGNASDLSLCDSNTNGMQWFASKVLAAWLQANPNARLVILAGAITAQNHHAGIQNVYFAPSIRGRSIAKQVIVCNLNGWSHYDVLKSYRQFVASPPSSCPREYTQWSP